MAFKQGNNPLSRKASPMRMSPFKKEEPSMSMDELQKMSAAQDAASKKQALELPQIEYPGSDYEMDQDMAYPGGERGRDYDEDGLKDVKKDGMSRKESPLNIEGGKIRHEKHLGRKLDGPTWGDHKQREEHHRGPEFGQTTPEPKPEPKPDGMSRKKAAAVSEVEEGSVVKVEGENKDPKPLTKKTIDVKDPREKKDNSKAAIKLRKSQDKADPKISKAQMRANKAKSKSEAAKETAEKGVSAESNQRNRAKAKRLAKKADRIEGREKRKAIRKKSKKDIKKTR